MNGTRILVVDDERHMRRLLQFVLQKTGATVETAGSGAEGLERLKAEKFDLLLVDLVMPQMDGFSTLAQIRQVPGLEHLPVVMLTSRGEINARERAADLGVVSFLTKPFSPLELTAEVRRIFGL